MSDWPSIAHKVPFCSGHRSPSAHECKKIFTLCEAQLWVAWEACHIGYDGYKTKEERERGVAS